MMAIIMLLAAAATGALNPTALVNKGRDARRKKDIYRIRIAMREYNDDKGYFPVGDLLASLNDKASCGSDVFAPYLLSWPCDPGGEPYHVVVEPEDETPDWVKIFVQLENKNDKDIPSWWYSYDPGTYCVGDGSWCNDEVNFGTSSSNVLWWERFYPCTFGEQCHVRFGGEGTCQPNDPPTSCSGDNCYLDGSCSDGCKVNCCENGQPCD